MGAEILIVDNDPIAGNLTEELLKAAGFSTRLLLDGRKAVEAVRESRPRAVLLDILMPGVDGLTVCREIRKDPSLSDIKVVMVSGKAFKEEKERARRYGADLFIEKPYNIDTFADTVMGVVGRPRSPAIVPGKVGTPTDVVFVKVWGCRSQAPGPDAPLTPCVSIETPSHTFVFDAGTGIVPLGRLLAGGQRREAWVLLTHFHQAHVAGLGGLALLREEGFSLRIGGPNDVDTTLEEGVRRALMDSYRHDPRPVTASLQLYEFEEGDYDLISGVRLSAFYSNHPTTTLGYRLDLPGRRIVYCPDSELFGEGAAALQDYDEMLGRLCEGADLLIHDARFGPADYPAHRGRGHSNLVETALFAARHGVGRLLLFHLDASYSEEAVADLERQAREALASRGSGAACLAARDGLVLDL